MVEENLKQQFLSLESIWKTDENGVEYILARDLARVLGYVDKDYWKNFKLVIEKAKITCEYNGYPIVDHFGDATYMVQIGSGATREVADVKLTRYGCYLTAQNGDSRKVEVAFAQNYFATQTRKFELVMQRKEDFERVQERAELKQEEKIFSQEIYQRGVDESGFARIRSKGDEVLFGGNTTAEMKNKLGVPENKQHRPLADFLDPIAITAKKLATQMSNYNVKNKDLMGEDSITNQHINSNSIVREALLKDNIKPENLPIAEDIKYVESRLNSQLKTITKYTEKDKSSNKPTSKINIKAKNKASQDR